MRAVLLFRLIPFIIGITFVIYIVTLLVAFIMQLHKKSTGMEIYDQKDLRLVQCVLGRLTPPSKLSYTFDSKPQTELISMIWPTLSSIVGVSNPGFFVEAGAYDGVDSSNTLWLEEFHGWTGLLVECHPEVLPVLYRKNRKAYIADVCLSKYSHPAMETMQSVHGWRSASSLGSGDIFPDFASSFTSFQVQTVPLYTLLAALNVTTVDFISLDIQSLEYDVVQNFPFHLVFVKVWLIEIVLLSPEVQLKLKKVMRQNGYAPPKLLTSMDMVFVHSSVLTSIE